MGLNYQLRFSRVACVVVAGLGLCSLENLLRVNVAERSQVAHKLKTENTSGTHATADTHRYHAVSVILPPHFVNQTYGELGTRATEGMSQGDCAAVDVHLFGWQLCFLNHGEGLHGKCFV